MKAIKFFGIASMAILCLNACESEVEPITVDNEIQNFSVKSSFGKKKGNLKLPFKAKFYTKRDYSDQGEGFCTQDPFLVFNYQVGDGNGTHLGNFHITIKFCEAGFDYTNMDGVITAANGDELYFTGQVGAPGTVILFDHPFYEAYFKDPFVFTGGTGRFEGASGEGMTDSFVNLYDDQGNFIPEYQTDHQWNGTIILPEKVK